MMLLPTTLRNHQLMTFCMFTLPILFLPLILEHFKFVQAFTESHYSIKKRGVLVTTKSKLALSRRSIPNTFIASCVSLKSTLSSNSNNYNVEEEEEEEENFMMNSWGQSQEWALRDNISKYTVNIPKLNNVTTQQRGSSVNSAKAYAMWRSMSQEIVELAGYDVHFIRKMHQRQLLNERSEEKGGGGTEELLYSPGVLPLLDEYQFLPNGGVAGLVEGLPGILDGTTIQTAPLVHVDITVPKRYALTNDGSTAYELGVPISSNTGADVNNSLAALTAGNVSKKLMAFLDQSGSSHSSSSSILSNARFADKEEISSLQKLVTPTAVVVGGAIAASLLSHHLTVNMFWV